VLMGTSSNFGNMFSMAGAALFLPFLPMLPLQVLLNNLLYDASETAVPFDRTDPEDTARPVRWDIRLIERFMVVIGPVSSLFDFLTFAVLLFLFHADAALFRTGWFVESLCTQVLVIFVIRTRRAFWRSRAHPLLAAMALAVVGVALVLPLTPAAAWVGMVPPGAGVYLFVLLATSSYLVLVEAVKRLFYRRLAP
jgi:P-type Mg2+ transporter